MLMSKGFRIDRAVPYAWMAKNAQRVATTPEPSSTLASSYSRWSTLTTAGREKAHREGTTAMVRMEEWVVTRKI
jgi:hypothetical protein